MKELTLIVNIKSWIESIEDFVLFLPRKEMILKNRIWDSSFTLLEAMYEKDFQKAFSCISMLITILSIPIKRSIFLTRHARNT